MPSVSTAALDAALNYIRTNATVLHICTGEPANFAGVGGVSLGTKNTPVIDTPVAGTPDGRKVVVNGFSDGTVDLGGIATSWAIVSGTELLATGALLSNQTLTGGNTLTNTAFDIHFPDAVSAP